MKASGAEDFEQAARRLLQRYAETILGSDADGTMEVWDDAAIEMPPDTPMVHGKQAIGQRFRAAFERLTYERFDIDLKELRHSGEYGFALGNYTYRFRRKADGTTSDREGKFLTIYRRQPDGSWKAYVDCFNLNARPK